MHFCLHCKQGLRNLRLYYLCGKIGISLCEDDQLDLALEIIKKAKEKNVKLYFSKEVVIADKFSNDANTKIVHNFEIPDGWEGLDAAPETLKVGEKVL